MHGVVVICTKDRSEEIEMSCLAAHAAAPGIRILVLDASTTEATRYVCEGLASEQHASSHLLYRRARQPGLARQRNEAIGLCRELGAEVVHFIDDDTEVAAGYFDAIERRFREEPDVMGVGGVIVNQPPLKYVTIKSFFMLLNRRPGSVSRSGRPTLGQYPGARTAHRVEWLSGCSMSFRIGAFDELAFDGRLQGYSLGEDYDFGFRLSRKHKLVIEPAATCIHHLTPTARGSMRAHGRQRTCLTHQRVGEHRGLGLSRTAFWWSVFGDFLTHAVHGVLRADAESLQEARGVLDGVVAIASHEKSERARESVASHDQSEPAGEAGG